MEHVLPEDRETVSRKFRHAIENKTDWDFECRIQQINGPVRWIWSRGRHVFDASGRAFKMAGIVQDITDRKNAEEALRESEKRFRTIFEEAPMGVALIDSLTGHIYEVNSRFAEIAGWTRAEMATIDWMSITHPDDVQEDLDNMALLNAGKISGFHMNKRYRRPDGSYVWISMTIAPITVRDKSQPRHLCMIEDITDRRKAEEELRRHRDHLEEMVKERTKNLEAVNKELSAFSYSVAHDIRAPLRSIDGFSKALLEDCAESLNEESRSYLGRIRTSSQLMAQLLDDVLNLAHVSQADLTRRDVDLSKIARSIAAEIKEAEPSRDTEFVIEPDIVVNGDATLLSLVMKNLLDNAWKFTAKTMHAKIEFAREQKDGKRIYFVRDNGVGFDAAYVDKLFNPFQRLHSKTEFHGTGIGLSIVKRIIHRHGGYVWAEGSVGQGATFYFTV
jgi:PAS domain S-box-containing protein